MAATAIVVDREEQRKNLLRAIFNDAQLHRRFCGLQQFYPPQVEAIKRLEQAIDEQDGEIIIVRSARQTMKNEVSGFVQARCLLRFRRRGGIYLRCAPTYVPQVVNSKRRLQFYIQGDPLLRSRVRWTEGRIAQCGNAAVQFLSAGKDSNIVGATASIALDVDEAHTIDSDKYEQDLVPTTSFTNSPRFMFGVGGEKGNLMHRYIEALPPSQYLAYPAPLWCDLRPAYRKAFEKAVSILGISHPIIRTQYFLEDVEAIGGFLDSAQQQSILSGEHAKGESEGLPVYVIIDIGGEDQFDRADEIVRLEKPQQDSTAAWALVADWRKQVNGYPEVRVVDTFWRTGAPLQECQRELEAWCRKWNVYRGVCDARGLGNQIAGYLRRATRGRVREYFATPETVSEDCFDLLARVNNGTVKMHRDDNTEVYREITRQLAWTTSELHAGDRIRITKPKNRPECHIDFTKALTYLNQVIKRPLTAALIKGESK